MVTRSTLDNDRRISHYNPMPLISASNRESHLESRREQLAHAALKVFVRKGIDEATVSDITSEAGLGKGTFYLYFENKDAIIDELVQRFTLLPDERRLLEQFAGAPLRDILARAVSGMLDAFRVKAARTPNILWQLALRSSNGRTLLEHVLIEGNELLAGQLRDRVKAGELRPIDEFVAARCLIGMVLLFILTEEVMGGSQAHPLAEETIISGIADLFLRGVLAPQPSPGRSGTTGGSFPRGAD